jgi:hypothetical protein
VIERRRYPRFRADEPARILVDSRFVLACTIRDISLGGACLDVDSPLGIPDAFDLIPSNSDGHACRVMWRGKDRVGVAFQY